MGWNLLALPVGQAAMRIARAGLSKTPKTWGEESEEYYKRAINISR